MQATRTAWAWIASSLICSAQLVGCSGTRGTLVVSRDASDAGAASDAQTRGSVWQPTSDATFQIQLTGKVDTSVEADVYIIDIDSSADVFSALDKAGRRIVCQFSAGTVETFRADASNIPESAWGNTLPDYPDEQWLDVTAPGVREVMHARLERAVQRGCSAVLPDNLAVHLEDSGFTITEKSAVAYARYLATEAEALGLSSMLSSDVLVGALLADYQMGLAFSCLQTDACKRWAPLRKADKTVMVVEVGDSTTAPAVCAAARAQGLPTIVKRNNLDAFRIACP